MIFFTSKSTFSVLLYR